MPALWYLLMALNAMLLVSLPATKALKTPAVSYAVQVIPAVLQTRKPR